ncbi:MAG: hypothetical protein RLZZ500_208 [Bacteroidota bacterium]|jgi:signal transduction histidine kinase
MGNVKLLNKTFHVFLLSCCTVLIIAAPLFYISIERLYMEDTDETLLLFKKEFKHYYLPTFKQSDIIHYNRYNRDLKILPPSKSIAKDTFTRTTFLDSLDNENEPYRVLQTPIIIEKKPYLFRARISLVESEDLMMRIAFVFISLIVLLLLVLLFVTNRFSKKIWQPFHSTLHKIKMFDLTQEQTILFDNTNIKEFEELNLSLQKLTEKNITIFRQQKAFIENASHELQTPLAVLKSKLELLLQNKDITSEQAQLLTAINLPLSRMSRINKNLLLLAKIENNQFADKETLELSDVVIETLELLAYYVTTKKILVEKKLSEKTVVNCNKTLLEILINNLLINAIHHNNENGKILIKCSGRTLIVSNTGSSTLIIEKLFERFAVSSANNTNSGLGLAIIREICNRYQWPISYHFEKGLHSFTIKF